MIFTEDVKRDFLNILSYIDEFSKEGEEKFRVDTDALWSACNGMRYDFPYIDGLEKSSAFKKIANFLAYFLAEKPIKEGRLTLMACNGEPIVVDSNAVIAFDIAITCLNSSTIANKDGEDKALSNPIYISDHSYWDIIQVLSKGITPQLHFHIISVYLEQLVYKCNPELEYSEMTHYPKS